MRDFLSWDIVDFNEHDAQTAGEIRATLSKSGRAIGPYDLLIAAQVLRRNMTLISADKREFSRIEGLLLEDWSKA